MRKSAPIKYANLLLCSSTVILMTALGCAPSGETSSALSETDQISQSIGTLEKVYVDQAVLEQIAPHKVDCPSTKGKGKGKANHEQICIRICHVPPGNPDNSHDKVLPLVAIKAHLGHGDYLGYCHTDEEEGGGGEPTPTPTPTPIPEPEPTPTPSPTPSEPPVVDDGGGEVVEPPPGDNDGGGEVVEPTPTPEPEPTPAPTPTEPPVVDDGHDDEDDGSGNDIPLWCVPYVDIDANCDGISDLDGRVLL